MGQLSNPPETLENISDQELSVPARSPSAGAGVADGRDAGLEAGSLEKRGRLSNPVLRRLSPIDVDQLVELYGHGTSIAEMASHYGVHRTTITSHLKGRGVARRRNVRKMTDAAVALAAERYTSGLSLAAVAAEFQVHERTLARELRHVDVPIRGRRGSAGP